MSAIEAEIITGIASEAFLNASVAQIKTILYQLYQDKKQPLEGAVFVGNIPILKVRGGQMMTSAFKYPESSKWENSSVASDRFYDDFDLKFTYLKQDDTKIVVIFITIR